MIAIRRLDKDGDWTFGNGKSSYTANRESVEQSLVTRLRCVKNDWFLNMDYGIDYFGGTPYIVEAQIRQTILRTKGVVELVELSSDFNSDERRLLVTAIVTDEQGNSIKVSA